MPLPPWLLALLEILVPLATGLALGELYRRQLGRLPGLPALFAALALAATGLAVATRFRVGVWDGAMLGVLLALGSVGQATRLFHRRARELLLAAVATALGCGLIELGVRALLPHPPAVPPPAAAHLLVPTIDLVHPAPAHGDHTFTPRHLVDACAYLYPDVYPDHFRDRTDRSGRSSVPMSAVLHLGDSMVMGLGLSIDQAFPALLEKRHPEVAQINGSMASMSADYHYVVAEHWGDRSPWPLRLVALHLFFNDPMEIDQGMPCCDEQPLLTYRDGHPTDRCPRPSWPSGYGKSLAWMARNSAPPYPLRVATDFSSAARFLDAWLVNLVPFAPPPSDERRDNWGHLEQVVRTLRDDLATRKIPLLVVVMPVRWVLEAKQPEKLEAYQISQRLLALSRGLDIPTLDAAEPFRELVKKNGTEPYFLGRDDVHFSADGHAALAEWLEPKITAYLQ
jgi:hypothetical protein